MSTDLHAFQNRLRVLQSIDFHELVSAGAIDDDEHGEIEWKHFRNNPFRYLMACDDNVADAIWRVIEQRVSPTLHRADAA